MDVIIAGGGIGGLTLGLMLHRAGIACRVFEAASELRELGVGINILPHACRMLSGLGLRDALAAVAVETRENAFFNRHGQLIYTEPCGLAAGYEWPQFSIHRADLHTILLDAARRELGDDRIVLGHRCTGFDQDETGVTVRFDDPATGAALEPVRGDVAVGCDGFHSVFRKQLHPDEGPASYGGINIWRGVTRMPPFLTGATMARAGSLKLGKMLVYPIRNKVDEAGNQLVNWAAEIESDTRKPNDWNTPGRLEDFYDHYAHMRFDWLDIAGMIETAEMILEYPMVDRDPVDFWSVGRVTLMGDAAHPMYPRGSNGAAQAILDADLLTRLLSSTLSEGGDPEAALKAYEAERLPATARIVRTNRSVPPDTVINLVEERTGGEPFARREDVISDEELARINDNYKAVTGYSKEALNRPGGA